MIGVASTSSPPKDEDDGANMATWWGVGIAVAIVGGLILWSVIAPLQGAVIAPATVTVESNRQGIQHLEGGIVGAIHVRDGDLVQAGDPLITLDDTVTKANLALITAQLDELTARQARLRAERDDGAEIAFPPELLARVAEAPTARDAVTGQSNLFTARRSSRSSEIDLLRAQAAQLGDRVQGLLTQADATNAQLVILESEIEVMRGLHQRGHASIIRLNALERTREATRGQLAALQAEAAQTRGQIQSTDLEAVRLDRTFREEVATELRQVDNEVAQLQERKIAAVDALSRAQVLAPRDGVVMNRAVHTVGGVIAPGQGIMEIVPEGDPLVLTAQVPPQDVDRVFQGQEVDIRLSAFNQRTTPIFHGVVSVVSADRLVDEVTGFPYYSVRIVMPDHERDRLVAEGIALVPGMPAETFIRTGPKSAIDYLLEPLTDSLARAFREQ